MIILERKQLPFRRVFLAYEILVAFWVHLPHTDSIDIYYQRPRLYDHTSGFINFTSSLCTSSCQLSFAPLLCELLPTPPSASSPWTPSTIWNCTALLFLAAIHCSCSSTTLLSFPAQGSAPPTAMTSAVLSSAQNQGTWAFPLFFYPSLYLLCGLMILDLSQLLLWSLFGMFSNRPELSQIAVRHLLLIWWFCWPSPLYFLAPK